MPPPESTEAERIRHVYATYQQQGWADSKWSTANPGNQAILEERKRKVLGLLAAHDFMPVSDRKILEVGCGSGRVMREFLSLGATPANCHGLDLLPDRIAEAARNCPGVNFQTANAERIPFPDSAFDLVVAFTVFSSILDKDLSSRIAEEMGRVLRSRGAILWFDFRFNNPWNPNVRGMRREHIHGLFPGYQHIARSLTLLPPIARRLGPFTKVLYPVLASIPALRSHLLCLLRKA